MPAKQTSNGVRAFGEDLPRVRAAMEIEVSDADKPENIQARIRELYGRAMQYPSGTEELRLERSGPPASGPDQPVIGSRGQADSQSELWLRTWTSNLLSS